LHLSHSASHCDRASRASIARSAQDFLEETVVKLADTYRTKTGTRYLCVAGGVFLNVLLIRALERQAGFDKVFVQPASGNAGSALGAAYLARKHLNGTGSREGLPNLYLGPGFGEEQIKAVLDNCKTIYHYLPSEKQLLDETTRLLREDKVVAWYQGRLEFGHRALGNRSILASPFSPYVTENLNQYVKHREDFHPFALSVPVERASDLFDCTDNCRFMSSIGSLKEGSHEFDRFAFNHRSIRVHTVEKQVNPRFWALLHKFGEDAPAPVLVNTSFNLFGEPLVCDPREAVRSFFCSGIDALVMGSFLVIKP
jgi:carbamoyltransferase